MQSKTLRMIIVVLVLVLCGYVIYPSIYWHFLLSEEEQRKYNKTSIELSQLNQRYENKIEEIKKHLPRREQRVKGSDGEYMLNLRPYRNRGEEYILNANEAIKEKLFADKASEWQSYKKRTKEAQEIKEEIDRAIELKGMRKNIIKLGLDLSGGTHLSISVDKRDLIKKLRKNYEIYGLEDKNEIGEEITNGGVVDEDKVLISHTSLKKELKEIEKDELEDAGEETGGEDEYISKRAGEIKEEYIKSLERELLESTENAIEIIRNRIDKFGVSEPKISKGLGDTIFVELPELDKRKVNDTVKTITGAGQLSFHIVDEEVMRRIPTKYYVQSGEARGLIDVRHVSYDGESYKLLKEVAEELSGYGIKFGEGVSESNVYPQEESDEFGNVYISGYYVLKNKVEVAGRLLGDAREDYDGRTGKPEVGFEFKGEGVNQFAKVTRENIQNRLAIVLDGKVKSAPVINTEIRGRGRITLGSNPKIEEVKQLVAILKAGVLPARLNVESTITIGAELGEETVKQGALSVFVGLGVVVIFMIFYYKLSGVIAVFGLMLNIYLLLSVLSAFGYTLTLPGIAGIILTIGMAVDANVIIFERMREETKLGKSRASVISSAYEKAFSAIFDSNITTVLVAFILSQIGTGIIKGFGVTLMVGIVGSMFTALFVTRLVFDYLTDVLRLKKVYV